MIDAPILVSVTLMLLIFLRKASVVDLVFSTFS